MAKWQRVRVDIPKTYTPTERVAIANEIIEYIQERTDQGKDKDNNSFPKYTKEYEKSRDFKTAGKGSTVDIRLTGETLDSMDLISHKSGSLLIGYDRSDKELNGKVEGNRIGSYGQSSGDPKKARDFLGITNDDLEKILKKFPKRTNSQKESTKQKAIEIVTALREGERELQG